MIAVDNQAEDILNFIKVGDTKGAEREIEKPTQKKPAPKQELTTAPSTEDKY